VEGTSGLSEGRTVRAGGWRRTLVGSAALGGSKLRGGWVRDSGVSGQTGVGLCAAARMLTRVTPTGVTGAFGVGSEPSGSVENAAHRPRWLRPRGTEESEMYSSGEEQSFARCARPPCWLHESVSGVRSR
jgi:hypothetical protein